MHFQRGILPLYLSYVFSRVISVGWQSCSIRALRSRYRSNERIYFKIDSLFRALRGWHWILDAGERMGNCWIEGIEERVGCDK